MADNIARRPQLRPDPTNLTLANRVSLRRGQPLLVGPGISLPTSSFPVLSGYVRLTTVDGPRLSLDVMTNAEPYMLPDGYAAGWETEQLVGRVSRLKWTGGEGLRQALPLTLDVALYRGLNIEDEWAALRHLARPPGGVRPPAFRIAGPVDHKELDWVIVGFDIDQSSTRRRRNRMVRQDVVVTIGQWSEADPRGTFKRTDPAKDRPRAVHVSYPHRTLKELAKYYLNDASRWREIVKLNKGLRDPDRRLDVGVKVWIPPR